MADEEVYGFFADDVAKLREVTNRVLRAPRGRPVARGITPHPNHIQWFPFRNDYGGTATARGVMRITGATSFSSVLGSGEDAMPILTCDRPNTTFYRQYAVNGPQDVATGEYGLCALSGMLEVAYDGSGTPAKDEGWGPKPSQFTISKAHPETSSIIAISDSTNSYVLCDFGKITHIFGRAQGAIAKDSTSGVVEVYSGAPTSGASIITSMTITGVHNPWVDIPDNEFVGVNWRNGYPCIDAKECT